MTDSIIRPHAYVDAGPKANHVCRLCLAPKSHPAHTVKPAWSDKPDGPDPSDPPAAFYVSVISGRRRALLAGPYSSHADALAKVGIVTDRAIAMDSRAYFYAFGTAGGAADLPTVFGIV